jgi:hypothetical protein
MKCGIYNGVAIAYCIGGSFTWPDFGGCTCNHPKSIKEKEFAKELRIEKLEEEIKELKQQLLNITYELKLKKGSADTLAGQNQYTNYRN